MRCPRLARAVATCGTTGTDRTLPDFGASIAPAPSAERRQDVDQVTLPVNVRPAKRGKLSEAQTDEDSGQVERGVLLSLSDGGQDGLALDHGDLSTTTHDFMG